MLKIYILTSLLSLILFTIVAARVTTVKRRSNSSFEKENLLLFIITILRFTVLSFIPIINIFLIITFLIILLFTSDSEIESSIKIN